MCDKRCTSRTTTDADDDDNDHDEDKGVYEDGDRFQGSSNAMPMKVSLFSRLLSKKASGIRISSAFGQFRCRRSEERMRMRMRMRIITPAAESSQMISLGEGMKQPLIGNLLRCDLICGVAQRFVEFVGACRFCRCCRCCCCRRLPP